MHRSSSSSILMSGLDEKDLRIKKIIERLLGHVEVEELKDLKEIKDQEIQYTPIEPGNKRLAKWVAAYGNQLEENELKRLEQFTGIVALQGSGESPEIIWKSISKIRRKLVSGSNLLALEQIESIKNALSNPEIKKPMKTQLQEQFNEFKKNIGIFVIDDLPSKSILKKLQSKKKSAYTKIKQICYEIENPVELKELNQESDLGNKIDDSKTFDEEKVSKYDADKEKIILAKIELRQSILEQRKAREELIQVEVGVDDAEFTDLKKRYEMSTLGMREVVITAILVRRIEEQIEQISTLTKKYANDGLIKNKLKEKLDELTLVIKSIRENKESEGIKQELLNKIILIPLEYKEQPLIKITREETAEEKQSKKIKQIELAILELRQATLEGRKAHDYAIYKDIFQDKGLDKSFKNKYGAALLLYNQSYANNQKRYPETFNLKVISEKLGNYEISDGLSIESTHESDKRVKEILGNPGYEVLHLGTNPQETKAARHVFLHELQLALDKEENKAENRKLSFMEKVKIKVSAKLGFEKQGTIKLEQLLGARGIELYKAAIAEEAKSVAFRNAVFLRAVKAYPGPKWLKRLVLWVGGPSAAGKTRASSNIIQKVAMRIMKVDKSLYSQNYVVSIDGSIDREVSQIRQLTLQTALKLGYRGISDLHDLTKLKLKDNIMQASGTNKDLSLVIPDTFVSRAFKFWKKSFKRFAKEDDAVQVYSQVIGGKTQAENDRLKRSVKRMGASRAWLEAGKFTSEVTLNNYNIGCESKIYEPFFQLGKTFSEWAVSWYAKMQSKYKKDNYFFDYVNDVVCVYNSGAGWKECEADYTGPYIVLSQCQFDAWMERMPVPESHEALEKWLTDPNGGKTPDLLNAEILEKIEMYRAQKVLKESGIEERTPSKEKSDAVSSEEKSKVELKSEVKAEIEPKSEVELKSEVKSESKSEGELKLEVNSEIKSESKLEEKAKISEVGKESLTENKNPEVKVESSDEKTKNEGLSKDKPEEVIKKELSLFEQRKHKMEAIYQRYLVEKALQTESDSSKYRFDTQGHLITEIQLNERDYKTILTSSLTPVEMKQLSDNPNYQQEIKKIIGPISSTTYCTIDIVGHPTLEKAYKKWLFGKEGSPRLETIYASLIKSKNRSSINALQKEMELHMRLSARIIRQKWGEVKPELKSEQWHKIHDMAAKRINNEMRKIYLEILRKCYNSKKNVINYSKLNKELDKARALLAESAKKELLVALRSELGAEKTILTAILSLIKKEDFEKLTATGNDYLHTDNRSQTIVRVASTDKTAHDKVIGADTCATRSLHRNSYKMDAEGGIKVIQGGSHIEVRVPSIAVKELDLARGVNDVADKFEHIYETYFSFQRFPVIYNLLTSLYGSTVSSQLAEPIADKDKQTLSAEMILKGSHLFNKKQLLKENGNFIFVQNIPVNQHADELNLTSDVNQEATLMSEIALLSTLHQQGEYLSLAHQALINKTYNEVIAKYKEFCHAQKSPDFFKDSKQGSEVLQALSAFRENIKITPEDSSHLSLMQLATRSILQLYATGLYKKIEQGMLIQSLSVFIEPASLAGCKSANERYQAVSGRVGLLRSMQGRDPKSYSIKEHTLYSTLQKFAIGQSSTNDLQKSLDIAYNDYNLQGAATIFSEEDQGAPSKVETFKSGIKGYKNWDTNRAESQYLAFLHQKKASKLQAHKGNHAKKLLKFNDSFDVAEGVAPKKIKKKYTKKAEIPSAETKSKSAIPYLQTPEKKSKTATRYSRLEQDTQKVQIGRPAVPDTRKTGRFSLVASLQNIFKKKEPKRVHAEDVELRELYGEEKILQDEKYSPENRKAIEAEEKLENQESKKQSVDNEPSIASPVPRSIPESGEEQKITRQAQEIEQQEQNINRQAQEIEQQEQNINQQGQKIDQQEQNINQQAQKIDQQEQKISESKTVSYDLSSSIISEESVKRTLNLLPHQSKIIEVIELKQGMDLPKFDIKFESERLTVTCLELPKVTDDQKYKKLSNGQEVPCDEYIKYIKATVIELCKPFHPNTPQIQIHTQDRALAISYMLICKINGIPYVNHSGVEFTPSNEQLDSIKSLTQLKPLKTSDSSVNMMRLLSSGNKEVDLMVRNVEARLSFYDENPCASKEAREVAIRALENDKVSLASMLLSSDKNKAENKNFNKEVIEKARLKVVSKIEELKAVDKSETHFLHEAGSKISEINIDKNEAKSPPSVTHEVESSNHRHSP